MTIMSIRQAKQERLGVAIWAFMAGGCFGLIVSSIERIVSSY